MANFKLKLYVSERMTRAGEKGVVRMPLRAREFTSDVATNDRALKIMCGNKKKTLDIKQAYREDLRKINRMIRGGELDLENKRVCCFLTKQDYDSIVYKTGKHDPWVTNELEPIMIGADPEFVLMEDGEVVRASEFLGHYDDLGSDGNPAEIRPEPSQSLIEVVNSIGSLLNEDTSEAEHLDWRAGACYKVNPGGVHDDGYWCPVGGHIHLGNPKVKAELNDDTFRALADILDDLVVVPMMKIDGPNAKERRKHSTYGIHSGGNRWQFENHEGRMEWRTPSGVWLCHPLVTEAVLGTTKAVTESFYARWGQEDYKFNLITSTDGKFDLTSKEYGSAAYKKVRDNMCEKGIRKTFGIRPFSERNKILIENDTESIKHDCKNLKRRFKELERYEEYKPQIEAFTDLVNASDEDIKTVNMDLKKNWRENEKIFLE